MSSTAAGDAFSRHRVLFCDLALHAPTSWFARRVVFVPVVGDSFGDIFRDLVGGIASAGGEGGVLNDVVDFLENRVRKKTCTGL